MFCKIMVGGTGGTVFFWFRMMNDKAVSRANKFTTRLEIIGPGLGMNMLRASEIPRVS